MNNNNIVGGNNGNNLVAISHHPIDQNLFQNLMNNGLVERYLIGQQIIPYNFNYNENVFIDNCMIIDLNGNNFIYNNQDIRHILMNAVQNNISNNSNVFNVITFRNIQVISNNLNELSSLVGNMVQSL